MPRPPALPTHSPAHSLAPIRSHLRKRRARAMSKLSPSLKALIGAPSARPFPVPAPPGIADLFAAIARDAASHRVPLRPWLAISAATTFTLNSPDSLAALHAVASSPVLLSPFPSSSSSSSSSLSSSPRTLDPLHAAEIIREVGLKCISFNGIPRTINCLNAFRAALPGPLAARLRATPSRTPTPANIAARTAAGRALWDSVYAPFEAKLLDKLALAHPDLPVVIMHGHYALLLADPEGPSELARNANPGERNATQGQRLGRALTSLTAIACLRAQGGVAPQVVSHVFGLRKAVADGTYRREGGVRDDHDHDHDQDDEDEGVRWLAGDEGGEWILRTVDGIADALGGVGMARL